MPLINQTFSQIITFTRASGATYFDATGTLQTAATDVPRFDYNPSTLAAQGFLVEEQRTNSVANNTMQGAAAGTPGTVPTNWSVSTSGSGVTREIVGTGTENGITYIDIKYYSSGTASATTAFTILPVGSIGVVAASPGQVWTNSLWVKIVAGSTSGFFVAMQEFDSGSNFLRGPATAQALTSTLTRYTQTVTIGASTASIRSGGYISVTNGEVVNITLRIGLPQLEQGAFATSVIPTTTTALTRSADVASVNTLSPWFNATEGTLFAEFTRGYTGNFSNYVSPAIITNNLSGASANSIASVSTNGVNQQIYNSMTVNSVEQLDYRAKNAQTTNKAALAYKTNDTQQFINGLAEIADTSCTVPTSVSQMNIGAGAINNAFINSWIRRITYYPRRLAQAEGIAITT